MAYPFFGNPYANPYYQPMPDRTTMQPIFPSAPQPQTAINNNGFVWVEGIEEANNFFVAPNNAVALWDKNAPCIYKKSADMAGKPTIQIFDLVERKPQQTDFVKSGQNDEIEKLRGEVKTLNEKLELMQDKIATLELKKKPTKVKEAESDG